MAQLRRSPSGEFEDVYADGLETADGALLDIGIINDGDVLVRDGELIEGRAPADFVAPSLYIVGNADWMYPSITAALVAVAARVPAPAADDRVTVLVTPGHYVSTAGYAVPSWVSVVGLDRDTVLLENTTTSLFTPSGDDCSMGKFTVLGAPTTSLWAFELGDLSRVRVHDVNMPVNDGDNAQGFLSQSGSTWTGLACENCVVNSDRETPGDRFLIDLENTSGDARIVDSTVKGLDVQMLNLSGTDGIMRCLGTIAMRVEDSELIGGSDCTGFRLQPPETPIRTTTAALSYCRVEGDDNAIHSLNLTDIYLRYVDASSSTIDTSTIDRFSTTV